MKSLKLLCALTVTLTAVAGSTAFAQRTRAQVPQAQRAQALQAQRAPGQSSQNPAVDKKVREMKKWVWNQATASYTEVVFAKGVRTTLLRQDDYQPARGINQSKLIKVSGSQIGKDGTISLTVLNNVSAHDLYREGMAESDFRNAVNNRIAGDRVRVSVKYPDGTTKVIKDGVPSKDVTAVPIDFKLQKGVNEIRVDRTDARGNVMGAAYMLGGRRVEIQWDGN